MARKKTGSDNGSGKRGFGKTDSVKTSPGKTGLRKTGSGKTQSKKTNSVRATGARSEASVQTRKSSRAKATGTKEDRARRLALAIADAGLEKKALNAEIMDVRGKVDYADYVVVMSGRSDRQVAAIARYIEEHLSRSAKAKCIGVEGLPHGSWVLMDYGDVIVHLFHEDTRGYYDLESLWMDAARVALDPEHARGG